MRKFLLTVIALGAMLGAASPVFAAANGVAKGVNPDANASNKSEVRQLVVGSDVAIGETVTTGPSGLVQLLFSDATKLVIGPSSSLVLQDYLVRADNTAGKFAINALAGTFRFVTGKAPKNDYVITTPTGTIGVRGTAFDLTISPRVPDFLPQAPITTSVLLFEGRIRICNLHNQCAEVSDACDFGAFNDAAALDVDNVRETRSAFRTLFPFANNQGRLQVPFWVTGGRECLNPAPNAPGAAGGLATASSPFAVPPTTTVPGSTTTTTGPTTTTTTTLPSTTTTTTVPSSTTTTTVPSSTTTTGCGTNC